MTWEEDVVKKLLNVEAATNNKDRKNNIRMMVRKMRCFLRGVFIFVDFCCSFLIIETWV